MITPSRRFTKSWSREGPLRIMLWYVSRLFNSSFMIRRNQIVNRFVHDCTDFQLQANLNVRVWTTTISWLVERDYCCEASGMNNSSNSHELPSMDGIPNLRHSHEIHDRYTLKAPRKRTYRNSIGWKCAMKFMSWTLWLRYSQEIFGQCLPAYTSSLACTLDCSSC